MPISLYETYRLFSIYEKKKINDVLYNLVEL